MWNRGAANAGLASVCLVRLISIGRLMSVELNGQKWFCSHAIFNSWWHACPFRVTNALYVGTCCLTQPAALPLHLFFNLCVDSLAPCSDLRTCAGESFSCSWSLFPTVGSLASLYACVRVLACPCVCVKVCVRVSAQIWPSGVQLLERGGTLLLLLKFIKRPWVVVKCKDDPLLSGWNIWSKFASTVLWDFITTHICFYCSDVQLFKQIIILIIILLPMRNKFYDKMLWRDVKMLIKW